MRTKDEVKNNLLELVEFFNNIIQTLEKYKDPEKIAAIDELTKFQKLKIDIFRKNLLSLEDLKQYKEWNKQENLERFELLKNELEIDREVCRNTTVINTETLALILEARVHSFKSKGINYEPFILNENKQINDFLMLVSNLVYQKPAVDNKYDVIMQAGPRKHSTPFSFRIVDNKLTIGFIDGSADKGNITEIIDKKLHDLLPPDKKLYYSYETQSSFDTIKIQTSSQGCQIFSTVHLGQMTRLDNSKLKLSTRFYSQDVINNGLKYSHYIQLLAPFYIKYAQTWQTLDKYLDVNSGMYAGLSKKLPIEEFLEQYSFLVPVYPTYESEHYNLKKQNRAIDFKSIKYLKEALNLLEEVNDEELKEILVNRINRTISIPLQEEKTEAQLINITRKAREKEATPLSSIIPNYLFDSLSDYTSKAEVLKSIYNHKYTQCGIFATSVALACLVNPKVSVILSLTVLCIKPLANYLLENPISDIKLNYALIGITAVGLLFSPAATTILASCAVGQLLTFKELTNLYSNADYLVKKQCENFVSYISASKSNEDEREALYR